MVVEPVCQFTKWVLWFLKTCLFFLMLLVAASSSVQANANKMLKKKELLVLFLAVTEFLRNMILINVVPADVLAYLYKSMTSNVFVVRKMLAV